MFALTFWGDVIIGASCFAAGLIFKDKIMAVISKIKAKI